MNNAKKYQTLINQKCSYCFRKDECWLLRDKHAGLELCLGPFKDQEDRLNKIKGDREKQSKPKADLELLEKKNGVEVFTLKRMLFESKVWASKKKRDEKEE